MGILRDYHDDNVENYVRCPKYIRMMKRLKHLPFHVSVRNYFHSCEFLKVKTGDVFMKKFFIDFKSIELTGVEIFIKIEIIKKDGKNELGHTSYNTADQL